MPIGDAAKQIFERARLPNEILGRIWNLSDTKQRGALDSTEFVIAMHLLTAYKTGILKGLPQALPPGLYEAASKRGSARTSVASRSPSNVPPVPAIPKQFSGPHRTQSPLRSQFPTGLQAQTTGSDWLVTPQDKAQFDTVFGTVDRAKTGYINGDQAVGFFSNAQLSEEALAQIWDLADIDSDGQLNRDEFAVAMYLVRQQRITREPIPQTLPPALVPPSARQPQVASPPRPIQQQTTGQRSAAEDLFGLDVFSASPQLPHSTGGSSPAPQIRPTSPPQQHPATQSGTFKPFMPTSSFGQSLTPHNTGPAAPAQVRSPPPSSDDLLGDADPEESKKLTQDTTDLANLSNQIGTLSKEMQSVQGKRAGAEQDIAQTTQQKRDFEARLAQARTMYEQEVRDFKALEERLTASKTETNKLQQEFSMLEANRQDLSNQYNQVSAQLEADQRENANLKEKIRQVNAQVGQLKPQLDKARSGARQQKGLVAINKKQLATVEGERDRLQEEVGSPSSENQELERQTTGSPAPVTSPAISTASQKTNPFFRRATTSPDNAFTLPPQTEEGQKDAQSAFDSVFGPSFTMPASTSSPPPVSFRTESPAQTGSGLATPLAQDTEAKAATPTSSAPSLSMSASADPPPPPVSRQITSNELPIPGHQSTETSSVLPSPPVSRFGTNSEADSQAKSPFEEQKEDRSDGEQTQTVPGAFPAAPSNGPKKEPSFDELFAGRAHQRSQSQKAHDFEEAFAVMKTKPGQDASKTNGGSTGEFPPIRELDDDYDDDDDSSSDGETTTGFEDDFTPVSPRKDGPEAFQFPTIESVGNTSTPLPGPTAEQSPPQYENKEGPASPPGEFKGLLPGRNDPTEQPDAPHSVESSTGAPIVGGVPQNTTGNSSNSVTGSKKPDFEAAFAGLDLAPAKESNDDSSDDEFDSPFSNKGPSTFDVSFDPPNSTSKPAPAGNDFFNSDSNGNAKAPAAASPQGNQASPHDWDSLFSALDMPKGEDNDNKAASPSAETGPGGVSMSSFPQPPTRSKSPGWALSVDTGEDDQILKRLTTMGYPRDESLAALEKFDYHLDKVSPRFLRGE